MSISSLTTVERNELRLVFLRESKELLEKLSELLSAEKVALLNEQNLNDKKEVERQERKVQSIFRIIHTLKASAQLEGLEELSLFLKTVEDVIVEVHHGHLDFQQDFLPLILRAKKVIEAFVQVYRLTGNPRCRPDQLQKVLTMADGQRQ